MRSLILVRVLRAGSALDLGAGCARLVLLLSCAACTARPAPRLPALVLPPAIWAALARCAANLVRVLARKARAAHFRRRAISVSLVAFRWLAVGGVVAVAGGGHRRVVLARGCLVGAVLAVCLGFLVLIGPSGAICARAGTGLSFLAVRAAMIKIPTTSENRAPSRRLAFAFPILILPIQART